MVSQTIIRRKVNWPPESHQAQAQLRIFGRHQGYTLDYPGCGYTCVHTFSRFLKTNENSLGSGQLYSNEFKTPYETVYLERKTDRLTNRVLISGNALNVRESTGLAASATR
jgi:hypothetical protein